MFLVRLLLPLTRAICPPFLLLFKAGATSACHKPRLDLIVISYKQQGSAIALRSGTSHANHHFLISKAMHEVEKGWRRQFCFNCSLIS